MKKIYLLIALLSTCLFNMSIAHAANWYVRDGGATYGTTATTCNGSLPTLFTGANGPNCAVNHPSQIIAGNGGTVRWAGGDTIFINGDSDITPGAQAQYVIGFGMPNAPGCNAGNTDSCGLTTLPAGASQVAQTHIIGTGTHYAQLWGTGRISIVLDAQFGFIDLQNLEITSHSSCLYEGPQAPPGGPALNPDGFPWVCVDPHTIPTPGTPPYGPYGRVGIQVGGTGETLTNVNVHRMYVGVFNAVPNGPVGNVTFTNCKIYGNSSGGINIGQSQNGDNVMTGTISIINSQVDFTGCGEYYPAKDTADIYNNIATAGYSKSVDNIANYFNCYGQGNGGYGDGVAFGPQGSANAGNWTVYGSSLSFNTQEGLDTLHGNGNGTIIFERSRAEGNGGNQVKLNGKIEIVENSLINADCAWWLNQSVASTTLGTLTDNNINRLNGCCDSPGVTNCNGAVGYYLSSVCFGGGGGESVCRANGDALVMIIASGSKTYIYNNTINTNGIAITPISFTGVCDATTEVHVRNNIANGGVYAINDSAISFKQDNDNYTAYVYFGTGAPCSPVANGGVVLYDEDYNVVNGMNNNNAGCNGAHDHCGTPPGYTGIIPMGTLGGPASSFYQSTNMMSLETLAPGAFAGGKGVGGITYQYGPNDFNNYPQNSPIDDGALQIGSRVLFCSADGGTCSSGGQCCNSFCCAGVCGSSTCQSNPVSSFDNMTLSGSLGR